METNDSNIRPAQTGGLKLMTVFIAVLALHVVVIGGFTVYHLMSGGSNDADSLAEKTHKSAKTDDATVSDGPLPEASQNTASSTNVNTEGPAADATASTESGNSQAPASLAANSGARSTSPIRTGPVIDPPPVSAPPVNMAAATGSAVTTPEFVPAPMVSGTPYVVKSHDSLAKIAHMNHTSVAKLKTANSLTTDILHIGQKLVIPARMQVASTQTASDASGTTTILGDSTSTPAMNVPATTPRTTAMAVHEQTTTTAPAPIGHHLYTVMKGDTLTKIARKFKTTPTAIMTANNITDPAKLSVGKKLKIPGQEARSATTTETPATPQPSQMQAKPATTAQLANFLQ